MQLRHVLPVRPDRRRSGFTLLELLAVIAIISVLVALSAAAVMKYTVTQQINVTKQRVNTISSQLNKGWKAVAQNAWKDDSSKYPPQVMPWANGDPYRARVIYVKCVLKQTFPTNFAEALNPFPMPPLPAYTSYLGSLGITGSTGAAYESSACLLMALQRGPSHMSLKVEDLGVGAASDFPVGTSTIKALVDSWGQPLIFCRWPAGSTVLNPSGPLTIIGNDPGDPQGLLTSATWRNSGTPPGLNLANFQTNLHPLPPAAGQAYKLVPLVASAGPDQKPGYLNPYTMQPDGTGADNDNIYPQN